MIMSHLEKIRLGYKKVLRDYFGISGFNGSNKDNPYITLNKNKKIKVPVKVQSFVYQEEIHGKDEYDYYHR